jgi:hypothetical protein
MPFYNDPTGQTKYGKPGVYYDGFVPPEERAKHMSEVVVGISNKSNSEVVEVAQAIHTDLTGNAYVTTPNPTLPALQTVITDADDAIDDYNVAKTLLAAKKEVRDNAMVALRAALMTEAATVQVQTGGIAAKILTTGFKVKAHTTAVGIPDQVVDLKVTSGADEGVLKAVWKKVRGAVSYEIEASTDAVPAVWVAKGTVTKTNALVNSFTSGQRISLRVRAIGSAGPGAWSAAGTKVVP